jgi:hypothetical protein
MDKLDATHQAHLPSEVSAGSSDLALPYRSHDSLGDRLSKYAFPELGMETVSYIAQ